MLKNVMCYITILVLYFVNNRMYLTVFSMPLSPKKQPSKKSSSSSHGASFQRYEESTIDAWDDGDDDLLVRLKLDSNMIQSTASQVINSHSETSLPSQQKSDEDGKFDQNESLSCFKNIQLITFDVCA